MRDDRGDSEKRVIAHMSPERVRVRLAQVEESLRVEATLRDHCQEWADEHQRAVLNLENERAVLREIVGS
jgi:hypothetical protein